MQVKSQHTSRASQADASPSVQTSQSAQFGSNQAQQAALSTTFTDSLSLHLPWAMPNHDDLGPPSTQDIDPIDVQYARTRPADATVDNCADLTAGDLVTANTRYVHVHVDAGGDLWLDIGALSSGDRALLTTWMNDLEGEVHLDPTSGRLVLGEPHKSLHFSADTDGAQDVLDEANAHDAASWDDAAIWAFLNGGEEVLEAEDADGESFKTDQTKPGAWYNGYQQSADGSVSAHKSAFDTRESSAPALDEDGLKKLIMRCLDVGKVKASLGGDYEKFCQGLQARFGEGHELGAGGIDWLAEELWSYLHTGAGTDGEVDIGRLQAIVRAVSPDTKETAETNTPFDGSTFAVGDTTQELHRGDGMFGRATMLSLMHLLGEVTETLTDPPDLGLVPGNAFDERDRFVHDRSGSMMGSAVRAGPWPDVKQAVDHSQGWNATNGMNSRTLGTFDINDAHINGTKTVDIGKALEDAYKLLHPDNTRGDQKAFAALFGLKRSDIFDRSGKLNTPTLRRYIGDGSGVGYGAKGESGLKIILLVLTNPSLLPPGDPLRILLENGSGTPGVEPVRLNVVMDEEEQSLEYLMLVQALAKELGVDVRLIAVPTGKVAGNLLDQLVFIDVNDISIDASGNATIHFVQGGVPQTKTVPVDGIGGGSHPQRFKGASIRLNDLQKVQGVSE